MPQDQHLYGQPAPKKQKRNMALTTSLDFTAQLTSLISDPSSSSTSGSRARASKTKDDLFASSKAKRRNNSGKSGSQGSNKLVLKEVRGTEEEAEELARSRRKMEEKARLYAAMKRGDYVPKENDAAPLIDFDRKWAEEVDGREEGLSSSDTDNDDEGDGDIIEYEDEFGRMRRGTKADKEKLERQKRRGLLGAEELDRISARPKAPDKLIYGDTVQTLAFNPDDPDKMEALARKRDRSATPPEMKHYEADKEIRTKGVGFYKFSKDEETRAKEMLALEEERLQTERERKEREEKKDARRREIEERRKEIEARRAKKMADSFLNGLASDI